MQDTLLIDKSNTLSTETEQYISKIEILQDEVNTLRKIVIDLSIKCDALSETKLNKFSNYIITKEGKRKRIGKFRKFMLKFIFHNNYLHDN
nr:MAG TPA: hypothetical protein [Caudoviricetes sp.]